ncbi:MAG: hypothetical protein N2Z20_02045 [Elusimicrobiales bacterium]|nr:hypothetical protein [Elusimicrobiales bacterium]
MKRIKVYIFIFIYGLMSTYCFFLYYKNNISSFYRFAPSDIAIEQKTSVNTTTQTVIDSFFFPQTNRNPFLSPMDYENIKKAELEKKKKEELLKQIAEKQKDLSQKGKDMEDFTKGIKLQGIVGKYAIINGDMVEEGSYYKKKILVEKVSSNYVIINYKGKRYKLMIK